MENSDGNVEEHGNSDNESSLKERVEQLEEYTKQQENRITVLEAALAHVVSLVESSSSSSSQQQSQQRHTPSARHRKKVPATSKTSTDSKADVTSSPAATSRPHSAFTRRTPVSTNSTSTKKHTTKPARKHFGHGHGTSSKESADTKIDHEEQSLKIYLRGRPVTVYAPSNMPFSHDSKPNDAPVETLSLEWVFGYRGKDSRSNIYVVDNEIVYFTAGVVVLYNVTSSTQRHYVEHTDDIRSLALHPDGVTFASGQVAGHDKEAGKPHVRVWDSKTLKTLAVIGLGDFDRAVCCISFSKTKNGERMVAVDESNDHVLSVWEWKKKKKLLETKAHGESVFVAEFAPNDHNAIVSCGKSHICFWTIEDHKITKRMGVFEKQPKPKAVLCIGFTENNDVVSGDSNGNIFEWGAGGNRITHALKDAHEGTILALAVLDSGEIISAGGRDRKIKLWDASYKPINDADVLELSDAMGAPRCIVPVISDNSKSLVIGTIRNNLLRCDKAFTNEVELKYLNQGHCDEVWGAAINPTGDRFVSCAYDKNVHLWNLTTRCVIWSQALEEGAQSATFNRSGDLIIIGTTIGKWYVLSSENGDIKGSYACGPEQLDVIRYSPDGKTVAVSSHDNFIYIYSVDENPSEYKLLGKCSGHSSFVTHIDWSKDSQYLQSTSGDYELLFWEVATCNQESSSVAMRDVEWDSISCVLGYPVCGIWPEGSDGTDVNTVARSFDSSILATGDDFGMVNLFKYPCNQPKSACHRYTGHSSHVTNVVFTPNDEELLSAGGRDNTLLLWTVNKASS